MINKALMAASTKPIILIILQRGEDYGYNIIQHVKEMFFLIRTPLARSSSTPSASATNLAGFTIFIGDRHPQGARPFRLQDRPLPFPGPGPACSPGEACGLAHGLVPVTVVAPGLPVSRPDPLRHPHRRRDDGFYHRPPHDRRPIQQGRQGQPRRLSAL